MTKFHPIESQRVLTYRFVVLDGGNCHINTLMPLDYPTA